MAARFEYAAGASGPKPTTASAPSVLGIASSSTLNAPVFSPMLPESQPLDVVPSTHACKSAATWVLSLAPRSLARSLATPPHAITSAARLVTPYFDFMVPHSFAAE
jgi:hypothetical protein